MRTLLFMLALIHFEWCAAQNKQQPPQKPELNSGMAKLFNGVKSKLNLSERNAIYKSLGFSYNASAGGFTDGQDNEQVFPAVAYPTDLNKDGIEEIFVSYGNTYTSGMTGSSIILFIKKTDGKSYEMQLGFPSTVPYALPTSNKGYPDLLMGGPGFEFPVWRWNGKEYAFFKTIKEKEWLKLKSVNIEELSQAYQKTVP